MKFTQKASITGFYYLQADKGNDKKHKKTNNLQVFAQYMPLNQ